MLFIKSKIIYIKYNVPYCNYQKSVISSIIFVLAKHTYICTMYVCMYTLCANILFHCKFLYLHMYIHTCMYTYDFDCYKKFQALHTFTFAYACIITIQMSRFSIDLSLSARFFKNLFSFVLLSLTSK